MNIDREYVRDSGARRTVRQLNLELHLWGELGELTNDQKDHLLAKLLAKLVEINVLDLTTLAKMVAPYEQWTKSEFQESE